MINIVFFSGGRGSSSLICEAIKNNNVNVNVIVNAYDDGKSTGEIREFFEMLGPSDIRKVQQSLLNYSHEDYFFYNKLFDLRLTHGRKKCLDELRSFCSKNEKNEIFDLLFPKNFDIQTIKKFLKEFLDYLHIIEKIIKKNFSFNDCSLVNCIYAGAYIFFKRDLNTVINFFNKFLPLKGKVILSSDQNAYLAAIDKNNNIYFDEASIVESRANSNIKDLYLLNFPLSKIKREVDDLSVNEKIYFLNKYNKNIRCTLDAEKSILNADCIIYSPGTQHSSLFPTYIAHGISEAIANNKKAKKYLLLNIGEDYETPEYTASMLISSFFKYIKLHNSCNDNELVNYILVNNSFNFRSSKYIKIDANAYNYSNIIFDAFEDQKNPGKHDAKIILKKIIDMSVDFDE